MAVFRLAGHEMVTDQDMALPSRASWLASIPLNIHDIPTNVLNIESKTRSNPFPWKGQFSPQFIQAILEKYGKPGMTVCDPFLGSGTVLGEAGRLNLAGIGSEINPAAYHMARIYRFINIEPASRNAAVHSVSEMLRDKLPQFMPLFGDHPNSYSAEEIESRLCELRVSVSSKTHAALLEALIVLLDLWKPGLDEQRLYSVWHILTKQILNLPYSEQHIRIINCDARQLSIEDSSVDLVITSPPYINVLNYHQQYRRSAEVLGWHLLTVARSEIGSNRKNRGNRFLTVVQYCQDITQALIEMRRICGTRGRIIIVLGRESTVRGTRFFNSDIVARLATCCAGLYAEMRQERAFRNRFGETIYEDILHLNAGPSCASDPVAKATNIAMDVLAEALDDVTEGSRSDLHMALSGAASVKPSPIYSDQHAKA